MILLSQALNTLLHCESTGTLVVPSVIGVNCTEQLLKELDVRWHLSCYKRYTLKKTLESEQKRFEEQTQSPMPEDQPSSSSKDYFTRSNSTIYRKSSCFFCDGAGTKRNPLHHVSCDSSGSSLQTAVELSGSDLWRVRLAESISPGDAHTIDVLYHKACWTTNVRNVLRKTKDPDKASQTNDAAIASDLEFIRLVEDFLSEGRCPVYPTCLQHT